MNTALAAGLNLAVGAVYLQYGTMTAIEMKRNWRTLGFSHFGAAWIAMAFTCGPHHMVHGAHMALEGRTGGVLDWVTMAVGAPAGVIWFLLRVEAFRGGRGDRFISQTPGWVAVLPTLAGAYLAALVAAALVRPAAFHADALPSVLPNLLLVGLYLAVGYYILRTQVWNRRPLGGWSLSGLALGIVFPTCAAMHAIFAYYVLTGAYAFDVHGLAIDAFGVPAAGYFLWVVHGLYHDTRNDWNRVEPARRGSAQPAAATT